MKVGEGCQGLERVVRGYGPFRAGQRCHGVWGGGGGSSRPLDGRLPATVALISETQAFSSFVILFCR